jgi:hypothetical protein
MLKTNLFSLLKSHKAGKNLFYYLLIFAFFNLIIFSSCSDNPSDASAVYQLILSVDSAYIHSDTLNINPVHGIPDSVAHWTGSKFRISYFVFTNDLSDSNASSFASITTPYYHHQGGIEYSISRYGKNNNGTVDTTFNFIYPVGIANARYYIYFHTYDSTAYLYIKNLKIEKIQ